MKAGSLHGSSTCILHPRSLNLRTQQTRNKTSSSKESFKICHPTEARKNLIALEDILLGHPSSLSPHEYKSTNKSINPKFPSGRLVECKNLSIKTGQEITSSLLLFSTYHSSVIFYNQMPVACVAKAVCSVSCRANRIIAVLLGRTELHTQCSLKIPSLSLSLALLSLH